VIEKGRADNQESDGSGGDASGWYYRSALFHQDGYDPEAAAINGQNQYHAIFDSAKSPMVHASTPATALLVYDAELEIASADSGPRRCSGASRPLNRSAPTMVWCTRMRARPAAPASATDATIT
jgi:hypothetical protein